MQFNSYKHFLIEPKITTKITKSHKLQCILFMHAIIFLKKQAHGSSATLHPNPSNNTLLCDSKHDRLRFFKGFTSKEICIFTDAFFCVLGPFNTTDKV